MNPLQLEQILETRGPPPRSDIAQGIRLVVLRGQTVTQAAKEAKVTRPSLSRSIKRLRKWAQENQA